MSKKLSRLEGRKLQEDSSCDSTKVLWSVKLPVTQITQQANSKSKMLRNKKKVYTDANTVDTPTYYQTCPLG